MLRRSHFIGSVALKPGIDGWIKFGLNAGGQTHLFLN